MYFSLFEVYPIIDISVTLMNILFHMYVCIRVCMYICITYIIHLSILYNTFKYAFEKQDEIGGRFFLINHLPSYQRRRNQSVNEDVLSLRPLSYTHPTYYLICKSVGSLTRHSKIHKNVLQSAVWKDGRFIFNLCKR